VAARPAKIAGLILLVLFATSVWADEEVNLWSKMEGFLQAQLSAKMKFLEDGSRSELDLMVKNRVGVDDSDPSRQRVFLHFRSFPGPAELSELKGLDVKVYQDTWIPPLENHPTGFMIADLSVSRALEVAGLDYIVRMSSAEKLRFPDNNLATAGAWCDSMWAQGLDGSGVVVCIHDSGLDSTHADIPTLVAGKDYHMAPDSLDDTLEGAHEHGTHVTGSALGRGTLSGGTYKGAAPGADLVFLKIGGDASSSATEAAMISAVIASVDTYGVDIISVSYGGLNEYNDGSEEDCQAEDWAVSQGVLYLNSAGNEANDWMHYSGTTGTKADVDTVEITVASFIAIPMLLTWYDGTDTSVHVDLELQYLDDSYTPITTTAYMQTHSPRGTESQYFKSGTVSPGTYYAVVTNNSPKSLILQDFHMYSVDWYAYFYPHYDPNYTVVGGACADQAIAVGAWVSKVDWTDWCGIPHSTAYTQSDIAPFSSRGPRIDGMDPQLPLICAGGSNLASCMDHNFSYSTSEIVDNDGLNQTCVGPADYIMMQGTSMACPIAAGVCALLLEHNPNLSPDQVKDILTDNAITDGYTGVVPNETWGYGKINAFIDITAPSRIGDFRTTTVSDSSAFLAWTAPGDDTSSGTATEYDIRYDTSLPAKADTAAWWESATQVVGEPTPQGSGSAESIEVTGLSPATPYYFAIKALDEHFNPSEISDITGDITLPVQLSSFQASPMPEGILLEWSTESETNNRGFHLSRSLQKEDQFEFVAFVDGAGNSASPRSYRFVDQQVRSEVTYWYLLESEDFQGQRAAYGPIQITAGPPLLPEVFALSQNYPNPFNPTTHIKYQLPKDVSVSLEIYNVMGQQVVKLVDDRQKAGYYEVKWAGRDTNGRELASGVYFYRLEAGEFVKTRKMVLLR
jgi:subtilisin family serine protease